MFAITLMLLASISNRFKYCHTGFLLLIKHIKESHEVRESVKRSNL